jgi:hypothetical protein
MSSSKFNAASRAATVSQKSISLEYEEIKVPVPDSTFASQFKAATGVHSARSNQYVIDVLPSFVSLNMFCIYHANLFISSLNPREHAKVSAATLTMYFMALIYAHFLVSDCFIRPQSSVHADFILDNNWSRDFLYYLLNLPVPEFLVPIIKQFSATSSARRNNIIFCPSAAGFNHFIHHGRIYPLNMYTNIHDTAASSNSRSDPALVNHELLTNPLFSFGLTKTEHQIIDTGMLIASNIPVTSQTNTFSYLNNKINQVFMTLFNPVLIRALQQKQSFAPINLTPPKFHNMNYNPYLMMFSLSSRNASELKTTLSSIAATFKGIIKCPGDLASLYTQLSGTSILNHSYSDFALPSFHYTHQVFNDAVKSKYTPLESEEFAKKINFLQQPDQLALASAPESRTTYEYPQNDPADKKIKHFDPDLYSVRDSDFPKLETSLDPLTSEFKEYDEDASLYPHLLYFNPYEESSTDAWLSSVSGLIIESEDIAASIVPHPEDVSHLGAQNSLFLQSAIAYADVVQGSQFTVNNAKLIFARTREENRADSQHSASLLQYHTKIHTITVRKTFVHTGFSRLNQGLTPLVNVTMPEFYRNFYGLVIHDNANHAHEEKHSPVNTESHRSLVFSPYSYLSRSYDPEWTRSTMKDNEKKIYFLTNFRTIFGTDVTLQEIMHPFDAMPIA